MWSGSNVWMNWWFFSLSFSKLKYLQLYRGRVERWLIMYSGFTKGNRVTSLMGLAQSPNKRLSFAFCFPLLLCDRIMVRKKWGFFFSQPELLRFIIEPLWLSTVLVNAYIYPLFYGLFLSLYSNQIAILKIKSGQIGSLFFYL